MARGSRQTAATMPRHEVAARQVIEAFETAMRGMTDDDRLDACDAIGVRIAQERMRIIEREPVLVIVGQGDAARGWNGEPI